MKWISFISFATLLFVGPFSLGIWYSAKLIEEREKLRVPYKILNAITILALALVLLSLVYFNHHKIEGIFHE